LVKPVYVVLSDPLTRSRQGNVTERLQQKEVLQCQEQARKFPQEKNGKVNID